MPRSRSGWAPPVTGLVHLGRALHLECLVRTLVVEFLYEGVEALLLLQQVRSGRARCLTLESPVHPLVLPVVLRVRRADALEHDAKPEPVDRERAQPGETG